MRRRARAQLTRRLERLEARLGAEWCVCGLPPALALSGARNITLVYGSEEEAPDICPDCELERIVVHLHLDLRPPLPA